MSVSNSIVAILYILFMTGCMEDKDPALIRQSISNTFDRADSKVQIHPVVVVNKFAIADWMQDEKAGRALLTLKSGKWQLILCGGKGLKDSMVLVQAGVPGNTAGSLVKQLAVAESTFSSSQVQHFDDFGPPVKFSDTNDHHPH